MRFSKTAAFSSCLDMLWIYLSVLSHFLLCTGPMVYGICYCPISMKERLGELGFAGERNFLMFSMEMFFMQNSNYGLEVGN